MGTKPPGPIPVGGRPPARQGSRWRGAAPPTLPVVPTTYASFWRTPAYRVWRSIVAIVVGLLGFLVLQIVVLLAALIIGQLTGGSDPATALAELRRGGVTPWVFLGNNVSLALLILLTILVGMSVFRQPLGWLCSVAGRFRWEWLGRCFLLVVPLWIINLGIELWISSSSGTMPDLAPNENTVLMIVGILLTQPLQAAGEEFGFRGLAHRSIAGFFGNQRVAWVVGALFSSGLFMLAHSAADIWLNAYYVYFALLACFLTWWTGGLEASIAIHVVNNLFAMWMLPFTDLSGVFDRRSGAGGPVVLINMGVMAVAAALIMWQAKRVGLERTAAPGRPLAEAQAGVGLPVPAGSPYPRHSTAPAVPLGIQPDAGAVSAGRPGEPSSRPSVPGAVGDSPGPAGRSWPPGQPGPTGFAPVAGRMGAPGRPGGVPPNPPASGRQPGSTG